MELGSTGPTFLVFYYHLPVLWVSIGLMTLWTVLYCIVFGFTLHISLYFYYFVYKLSKITQ